jgi:hypothetical protein
LRPASADQHEHDCDELGTSFITALTTCPICDERLDIAPAFPSTVAHYLKRTKSAHKVNVTFDYETVSFVPVEDGEFVVINNGDPTIQPIVLPRASRFATSRDFYEYYQDYYHCPKPEAGEIHILRPAAVNRVGAGWRIQATGLLEVIAEQPKKKPVVPAIPEQPKRERVDVTPEPPRRPPVEMRPEPPRRPPVEVKPEEPRRQRADFPPPVEAIVQKRIDELRALDAKKKASPVPTMQTCHGCGASIESRYAFCWKCGAAMSSLSNGPVVVRSKPLPLPMDDDEMTVQHDLPEGNGGGGGMFSSWTLPKPPERDPSTSRGSVLKLMAIGGVAFLLLALGLFGLTRSDSAVEAANTAPPVAEQPAVTQPAPAAQPANVAASDVKPQPVAATVNPEDELQKLREKRLDAGTKAAERSKVFQAIAKVERQYPRDYRFPYERAKLAANGSKATSRNEAFKALSVAAEKAISTGKANEMLSGLEADKAGDFQKLAQGRQEWSKLTTALKRKDTSLLAREHSND